MSWLWKSDTSAASFERALSKLSTQITAANVSLETTRSRGRRLKALWTLYTTLTYLVAVLILVLVIGPQNWSLPHYGGLIGMPGLIYGGRRLVISLYDWRAGRQQTYLNGLQKQRDAKIADLKKATKYDSTQELLQKYGGAPPTPQRETPTKQSPPNAKAQSKLPAGQVQRTGLPPPPTANIPGRQVPQPPVTPPQRTGSRASLSTRSPIPTSPVMPEEPGFAPNAFSSVPPSQANYEHTAHWYDRILDVLLGEDETLAKNRLVLLCQNCKLVNGQAPPGMKSLEQLGKWRCASCGAWNGAESEGMKAVKEIMQRPQANTSDEWQEVSKGDEIKDEAEQVASKILPEDTGITTSKAQDEETTVTKRMTRSSGQEPVEGL